MLKKLLRYLPLILIIVLFVIAYKYNINHYLNYATLKQYHIELSDWVNSHFVLAICLFMLAYILVVVASIPGATICTLVGGFLFGSILGTLFVVISATIGATLLFMAVKLALGDVVARKIGGKVKFMEQHFKDNAFFYLLSLRFLPVAPFFLINLAAGLFAIRLRDFFFATLLGIIPGSFIYVNIGASLNTIFAKPGDTFNFSSLVSPQILIAFALLGLISIIPVIIKQRKRT